MSTATDKHKPSEKHTLDEVLHSLQDLLRSDLLEGEPKPPPPPKIHHGKVGRPRKPAPPAPEAAAPQEPPPDLDSVMRSLKALVNEDLSDSAIADTAPATDTDAEPPDKAFRPEVSKGEPDGDSELRAVRASIPQHERVESEPVPRPDEPAGATVPESPVAEVGPHDTETAEPITGEITLDVAAEPIPEPELACDAAPTEPGPFETVMPVAASEPAAIPPGGLQQEFFFDAAAAAQAPADEFTIEFDAEPAAESAAPAPETVADAGDMVAEEITLDAIPEPPGPTETAPPLPVIEVTTEPETDAADEGVRLDDFLVAPQPAAAADNTADRNQLAPGPESAETEDIQLDEPIVALEPETPTIEVIGGPELETPEPESVTIPLEPEPEPPTLDTVAFEETPALADLEPPAEAPDIELAEPPGAAPMPKAESAPLSHLGESVNFDDIPVLDDVVVPPPAPVPHTPELPFAPPERMRELAIRVIARLNIERRKGGEAPLPARTIDRLQKLLAEEMEKAREK